MPRRFQFLCATLLALLALNLFSTLVLADDGQAAFGMRPVRYDPARPVTRSHFVYEGAVPGQVIQDEVLVSNSGTVAGTVHLYTVDSATGQSSGTTFLAEGDQQQKVGQWLQFEQQDLTLLPGESRAVKFTVTVPAGVAPGQHLGGLAAQDTAVRKGPSAGAIQVSVQSRVVTAVQINVAGPTIEQVSVTGVTTKGAEGYQQLLLGLRNDGNSLVKPTGTLLVVDADGREIQRLALKLDTFVPETEIQYPVFVERQILGPGKYHAKLDLQYGKNGVTSYEGDFTVTEAQAAQVFQTPRQPLAPPQPVANSVPSASPRPFRQVWIALAGLLIVVTLGLNLVLLWRRAIRRRA